MKGGANDNPNITPPDAIVPRENGSETEKGFETRARTRRANQRSPWGRGTLLELIDERQPLMSGPDLDSSRSTVLTGYESTASDSSTEKKSSDGEKREWWPRVRDAVTTKELFIRYIPEDESGGADGYALAREPSKYAKWSDLIRMRYEQEFTLHECFLLFVALLATGALAFSLIERWSAIDSLYFTLALLTTVGYGDVVPATVGGKMFAAVFALGGVVVFGLVLGVLGSQLVEAEMGHAEGVKSMTSRALETAFAEDHHGAPHGGDGWKRIAHFVRRLSAEDAELSDSSSAGKDAESSLNVCDEDENPTEGCASGLGDILGHLSGYAPFLAVFLVMTLFEKWSWYDAIYYCVVTATTIGFGDVAPSSPLGRICAILFVPIVVGGTGYILGNVASFIIEKRREQFTRKLWSKELKIEDIEALAENSEEGVSEFEYIKFMLVAMQKVDGDLIDALHKQFRKMDMAGDGKIDRSDLAMAATRKMKRVSEKMRLYEYKKEISNERRTTLLAGALNKMRVFHREESQRQFQSFSV